MPVLVTTALNRTPGISKERLNEYFQECPSSAILLFSSYLLKNFPETVPGVVSVLLTIFVSARLDSLTLDMKQRVLYRCTTYSLKLHCVGITSDLDYDNLDFQPNIVLSLWYVSVPATVSFFALTFSLSNILASFTTDEIRNVLQRFSRSRKTLHHISAVLFARVQARKTCRADNMCEDGRCTDNMCLGSDGMCLIPVANNSRF